MFDDPKPEDSFVMKVKLTGNVRQFGSLVKMAKEKFGDNGQNSVEKLVSEIVMEKLEQGGHK